MSDEAKMMDGCGDCHEEFGANISFQAPARFLLDVALQNVLPLGSDNCPDLIP